ncbi:HtaA domain-containing protein OS=Streptomyces microflavus OX=1919 GN=HUT09_08850 PE=4 SV=1 [Streptomyces microflavus]
MGTRAVTSSFKGGETPLRGPRRPVLDSPTSEVLGKAGKITVDVTTKSRARTPSSPKPRPHRQYRVERRRGHEVRGHPRHLHQGGRGGLRLGYKEGNPVDPGRPRVKRPRPSSTRPSTPRSTRPREAPGSGPAGQAPRSSRPPPRPPSRSAARSVNSTLDWGLDRALVPSRRPDRARQGRDDQRRHGQRRRLPLHQGHRPPSDAEKNTLNAQFKGKVRFLGHETNSSELQTSPSIL